MKKATAAFAKGVNYAALLTGLPMKKIVLAEVGSILKACAAETPEAKLEDVERGAILRALRGAGLTRGGQFTVNAGVKKGAPFGRVFMVKKNGDGYRRTHDAGFQTLNQHYRDPDWLALKQTVELAKKKEQKAIDRAPESVSLARGSWVLMADAVGIRLEDVPGGKLSAAAIVRARLSRARADKQKNNGTGFVSESPRAFFATIINRYPGGNKLGFERLLAVKISGRVKFLANAVRKGYDGSLEQTARLFPGWVVKKS